MDPLIETIQNSICRVTHPRFYETERGFQGEFIAQLNQLLPTVQPEGTIVEQEYQKRLPEHGINTRPDVILHVPFDASVNDSRAEGNFVAIELKLAANQSRANEDFCRLAQMCDVLDYTFGIFINIDSAETHLAAYTGPYKERLSAFAVRLRDGQIVVESAGPT
jgi:hypothetical protein